MWTREYVAPLPLRCRGPVHFYSARDRRDNRPHVIAVAPRFAGDAGRARLAELARVHAIAHGANVPNVTAANLEGDSPWVALDCDAIADLETAEDFVRNGGDRPSFECAATVGKTIMETLARTHALRDPQNDRSVCLGGVSTANVQLTADGRIWIVGFGAGPLADAVIAPEVASGGAPSPGSDLFALLFFLRMRMALIEMPPAMVRAFSGATDDPELVRLVVSSHAEMIAAPPGIRPGMEYALEHARRIWRHVGFDEPDGEGFASWVTRAIDSDVTAEVSSQTPTQIRVAREGEWIEIDRRRRDLATRRPLRRIAVALAAARCAKPGAAITVEELVLIGWPNEDVLAESGANRVYVAVSALRKLCFGSRLQRWDEGYRLDPEISCTIEAS